MATLVLSEFRCVIETDEIGDDSPYFVIFVGNADTSFSDVKRIREPQWDNDISSGKLVQVNSTVSGGIGVNSLVLVALLEEDNNPDISGQILTNIKQTMSGWYNTFFPPAGGVNQLETKLMPIFQQIIEANLSNDDVVAFARLKITTLSGNLNLLHMWGDGGYYRVRFKMT